MDVGRAQLGTVAPFRSAVLGAEAPADKGDGKDAAPPPPSDLDYSPVDYGELLAGVTAGTLSNQFLAPHVQKAVVLAVMRLFPRTPEWAAEHPYRASARNSAAEFAIGQAVSLLEAPIAAAIQGALHRIAPSLAPGEPKSYAPKLPPAPALAGGLVKSITVPIMMQWLERSFTPAPPPSAPPPADPPPAEEPPPADAPPPADGDAPPADGPPADEPPADDPPADEPPADEPPADEPPAEKPPAEKPPAEAPAPDKGRSFLGKDLSDLGQAALRTGMAVGVSAFYDQVIGPVVNRRIHDLMGQGDKELPAPAPLTPGKVANAMAGTFLKGLLLRKAEYPAVITSDGQPVPTGGGGIFATALMNGLLSASFSATYGRGVGQAIEDTVNGWAGIAPAKRAVPTPGGERLVRTVARSGVSSAVSYAATQFTQPLFLQLGQQLGGSLGPIVAMAGAALIGMAAGSASDALLGQHIGRFAGKIYSSLTGKPTTEERLAKARESKEAPADAKGTPPASAPAAPAPATGQPAQKEATAGAAAPTTAVQAAILAHQIAAYLAAQVAAPAQAS